MLRKLLSLYENSILLPKQPDHSYEQFFIFFDESQNEWIGIPKKEISEKELNLLKKLYELVDLQTSSLKTGSQSWYEFLYLKGPIPPSNTEAYFRMIQFHIKGDGINQNEIESALKGFFTDEVIIIWENVNRGVIIEEKKLISLSEKEFITLSETIESDFFIKISFYIGKIHLLSHDLPTYFYQEKEYFNFGKKNLGNTFNFAFERVFPAYLTYHLQDELKHKVKQELNEVFLDDQEMFSTIKVFLENNLNASMTAKKLYIHRNTLQYRIDKFVEKTGIQLKDFYGAFTVFLACLLFEQEQKK
ncbi:PucR family transcriptional regulator [Neobacillus ginsengisoli]|uniref:PucR C-terminal helix-turn-helix domain-containing protein n=1 Tax=Neobacillus ginsengisoli TaxID=904295 RepID=A0ABT9XS48_9BACI|nr:helix-turn-helix domain-containing protein [Neobacillus ginsengisoli]MDQ0198090.1 hypothetical protein [Neobacillus ginsengisoli]